jgi:adenylate cyclase, class 2
MLEIEVKYTGADFADLEQRLAERGVSDFDAHEEEDHYFQAPDRDFKAAGEAFRLRRTGRDSFLTYKGPRRPGEVKVRPELELPLPPGEDMAEQYLQLFHYLGYRVVAVVRKRRRQYHLKRGRLDVSVCLDEVVGLGRFVELEVLAGEHQVDLARQTLLDLAAELGLSRVEPRSYLGLWLASHPSEGTRS